MRTSTRLLPCALIAAGALASIATSRIAGWTLLEPQDLAPSVIDNQAPSVRYRVHAELHGPAPLQLFDGRLDAVVSVEPRAPVFAPVTIELRSLTHPELGPSPVSFVPSDPMNRGPRFVSIDAWLACEADPCVEDFELEIRRDPLVDVPAMDVSGRVQAYAEGEQTELPPGTSITITAERAP